MALTAVGLDARGRRRLPVAGRHPAARRQLVQLLPAHRRQGRPPRHQRVRLPGHRGLAPLHLHRRPRRTRAAVADGGRGRRLRPALAAPRRLDPLVARLGRHPRGVRPPHRARRRSTTASAAPSPSPSGWARSAPTGSWPPAGWPTPWPTTPAAFAPKVEFAMDWYYPILSGALSGDAAHRRIDGSWSTFVMEGRGVRCVSTGEWVTAAETAECVLALDALGRDDEARRAVRAGSRPCATRTAPTGPAWSTPRRRPTRRSSARPTRPGPWCWPPTPWAAARRPRDSSGARGCPSHLDLTEPAPETPVEPALRAPGTPGPA